MSNNDRPEPDQYASPPCYMHELDPAYSGLRAQTDGADVARWRYDDACYRLGYGGGFFDRTLAQLPSTIAIGVGYAEAEIATVYPQPFDIPMHHIVTERGTKTG